MSLSERSHNVLNHKVWVICYAINSRLQFSEIDGRCRLYKSAEHRKAEDIDLATIIPVYLSTFWRLQASLSFDFREYDGSEILNL